MNNFPKIAMIEVTNSCNFSCVMCPNSKSKREKGFMSYEIFKKTIEECIYANIKSIKLYTTGESLLHPEFMKFWNLCKDYDFNEIIISTNGSLLSKDMFWEFLKNPNFKLQFSFSGWDKESYEKKYVNGDFCKIIETIKWINENSKNVFYINGVVNNSNEIVKTKDFLKSLGIKEEQLRIHKQNNWNDVILKDNLKHKKNRYYCHIANSRIGILYDGRVTACGCLDLEGDLIIGNIKTESIDEIRSGEKFNYFVKCLEQGNVDNLICSRCDSLKRIK